MATTHDEVEPRSPRSAAGKLRLAYLLRRGHLYVGLLLFPWAILYGVTAFLFNHPTAFSDRPMYQFTASDWLSAEEPPPWDALQHARSCVSQWNQEQRGGSVYPLPESARWSRDFTFATAKTPTHTINVMIDMHDGGGIIRLNPRPPEKPRTPAPFVKPRQPTQGSAKVANPATDTNAAPELVRRLELAVAEVLVPYANDASEIQLTSIPDVVFTVSVAGRDWEARFNPLTQSLRGEATDEQVPDELSWRRFLLRLHTAHGYPGAQDVRWYWAVIVDAMAFTMCFWGVSGLVMWWQLKAQRRLGILLLIISGVAAALLGIAMHQQMS